MKVSCEQCGAAYAVADNKVAGRSLTLRCRKCGAPMPVDGRALIEGNAVPPLRASELPLQISVAPVMTASADEDAVWHIAVGDTTQGPYTLDELATYYAQGSVVLDTLVFRDGWPEWKQASEIEELTARSRDVAAPRRPPPVPAGPGARKPLTFAHAAMGRDPFADAVPSDSPRVNAEDMFTPGRRHEGTVQFSVDQIRALSAVSVPSLLPTPAARSGFASGDGSGLIDMRSLPPPEAESSPYRSIGNVGLSPLDTIAPLTLPTVARRQGGIDMRTKLVALVSAFGIALAGGVVALAILRAPAAEPAAAPAAAAQPNAPAPIAAAPEKPALDTAALAAVTAAPKPAAIQEDDEPEARASGKSRKRGSRRSSREPNEERSERKSTAPSIDDVLASAPKETKKSGSPTIDDLLDSAVNGKRSEPKSEPVESSGSSLPMTPGRDAMLAALGKAKAKAASCKGSGVATAAITISGKSGRASSVSVSGVDGSAKGCVEKAVRATSFPKFQKDKFDVKFPFKLGG
jgi:predicted Zn finger-like uncharacterized protein